MKKITLLLFALIPFIGFSQVDLPITFEDTASVDYMLADFGGNMSAIVTDPTDSTNLVGQAIKTDISEIWAGTTNGGEGLATAIPFTASDTRISARVWSPDAGTPIRLKVENAADGGIAVEAEAITTGEGAWDTLVFDFAMQVDGTAGLNISQTYDKISIFFNFGTTGADAGEKTYYWDDIIFVGGGGITLAQVDLPITFEDTSTVNYDLADFGGNMSMIVVDPTDATNLVGQAVKDGPETWAGTVIGGSGLASAIPFTANETKVSVRVWSPTAGTPILIKVENAADGGIFAETGANTTMAQTWETLEFDLAVPSNGTFDLANVYDKIVIFFDFGTVGTGETYYWDDMTFVVETVDPPSTGLLFDFETPETTTDFQYFGSTLDGSINEVIFNPNPTGVNTSDSVATFVKAASSEVWAGAFANPAPAVAINVAAGSKVCVDVHMDHIGNLAVKLENSADGGPNWVTLVPNTVENEWETLCFETSANSFEDPFMPAEGFTYGQIVVFFDFGMNDTADETYYFDNIRVETPSSIFDLPKERLAFKVFPNLTSDYATVTWSEVGKKTISVYDVSGTLLQRINVNPFVTEQTIDVNGYNQGTYFIRIDSENKVGTKKLVVGK